MTLSTLKDRDAIVTRNNMIFRVYGYSHPSAGYICDPEYAPASIYRSNEPRAVREKHGQTYYKFYSDEGLRFVREKSPEFLIWYRPLRARLVGVKKEQIAEKRLPQEALKNLLARQKSDQLLEALHLLIDIVKTRSTLLTSDFGAFGSLLHDFYHPSFSDLDLTINGRNELKRLRETLATIYREENSPLRNEFDTMESVAKKDWKFKNFSLSEYVWHQERKQVYAVLDCGKSRRTIKAEFEPVKRRKEIRSEDLDDVRIRSKGWTKILARVTDDADAPFMPSIYQIEPEEALEGPKVDGIRQIVSFVEEFRLQAQKDELILVEGNLEEVDTAGHSFNQISLTYCPRYYEQVLKVVEMR
jgi:predicted nucleotidyltransferase